MDSGAFNPSEPWLTLNGNRGRDLPERLLGDFPELCLLPVRDIAPCLEELRKCESLNIFGETLSRGWGAFSDLVPKLGVRSWGRKSRDEDAQLQSCKQNPCWSLSMFSVRSQVPDRNVLGGTGWVPGSLSLSAVCQPLASPLRARPGSVTRTALSQLSTAS